MRRSRPRQVKLKQVAVLVLCLAAALLSSGFDCGGGPTLEESKEAVHLWSLDADRLAAESRDGSFSPSAVSASVPSSEELDKVSSDGVTAGEEAREAADELNEEGDLEDAQSVLCELFVEYKEEETKAFTPWLMDRVGVALELHRTPPEQAEDALKRLEDAAHEAESPGAFVIDTASAALCIGG